MQRNNTAHLSQLENGHQNENAKGVQVPRSSSNRNQSQRALAREFRVMRKPFFSIFPSEQNDVLTRFSVSSRETFVQEGKWQSGRRATSVIRIMSIPLPSLCPVVSNSLRDPLCSVNRVLKLFSSNCSYSREARVLDSV